MQRGLAPFVSRIRVHACFQQRRHDFASPCSMQRGHAPFISRFQIRPCGGQRFYRFGIPTKDRYVMQRGHAPFVSCVRVRACFQTPGHIRNRDDDVESFRVPICAISLRM